MTGDSLTDRVIDYETNHWAGVGGVALIMGGLGVVLREPALVLAGLVGVVFTGYATTAQPIHFHDSETGSPVLVIRRKLDDTVPDPGEEVTVTVEVRNEGEGLLSDTRIVDGVPPELEVTSGSPRHGAFLRPETSTVFTYTVTAARGEHVWQPAQITVADPSASIEREISINAETALTCSLPALKTSQLQLRELTTHYPGRVRTASAGEGVEFHSTREYHPSDPPNRINWRQRAKTGELGTLEFHEERAATVMLVIDTRKAAYRAPEPGGYHAVERNVDAANRIFAALLDTGDRVGITTFGQPTDECWLTPGVGEEHRAVGRALLTSHPALSSIPPSKGLYETFQTERRSELKQRQITELHRRLSNETQVFLFSPCCDGYIPEVAQRLDAYGHLVTVISPDPTASDTPYRELAQMEREDRLTGLRRQDIRVIDWKSNEPLEAALAHSQTRGSQ